MMHTVADSEHHAIHTLQEPDEGIEYADYILRTVYRYIYLHIGVTVAAAVGTSPPTIP